MLEFCSTCLFVCFCFLGLEPVTPKTLDKYSTPEIRLLCMSFYSSPFWLPLRNNSRELSNILILSYDSLMNYIFVISWTYETKDSFRNLLTYFVLILKFVWDRALKYKLMFFHAVQTKALFSFRILEQTCRNQGNRFGQDVAW